MAETFNTNLSNVAKAFIKALSVPVTVSSQRQYFTTLFLLAKSFEELLIHFKGFKIDDELQEEEMMASKIRNRITEIYFVKYFLAVLNSRYK